MRSIGCGASSAERFCGLMNMPPIPTASPYAAHNKALLKATKDVCEETMSDAAKEIHELKNKSQDEIADCGVCHVMEPGRDEVSLLSTAVSLQYQWTPGKWLTLKC